MNTIEYRDRLRDKMLKVEAWLKTAKYVYRRLPANHEPLDKAEVRQLAKEAKKHERRRAGVRD
jgi:hypothetical protein